ncbi:MAG: FecR domain-containing protein, partial [Deltaproteobacteria bacterium]|nr:FecR domain-containing protein [Deltaproteobacteria bacterium]
MNRYKVVLALVLVTMFFIPSMVFSEEPVGLITVVKGKALVFRAGSEAPVEAAVGMPLFQKDRIETAKKSKMRIEFVDGSNLAVAARSKLSLEYFKFDRKKKKRSALINLSVGKIKAFANDLSDFKDRDFKVKTPTAVIGVRGTTFMVFLEQNQDTKAICISKFIMVQCIDDPTQYRKMTEGTMLEMMACNIPGATIGPIGDKLPILLKHFEGLGVDTSLVETPVTTMGTTGMAATNQTTTTTTTT